jgi:heme/copper-type cytochrome/quinol oxidase subunit 4
VYASAAQTAAGWRDVLLFFAVLAALYGAIAWTRAQDELRGRLFWIISIAGMAFAAAVQSQQEAALAWGLALLYPGALLFLASIRTRSVLPVGVLSLLALTSLPFTPTFTGLWIFQHPHALIFLLPVTQVVLVAGYFRHMMRESEPLTGVEPWVKAVYIIGLGLLPVNHYLTSYFGPEIAAQGNPPIWPLAITAGAAAIGAALYWRRVRIPGIVFDQLDKVFSLRWISQVFGWMDRVVQQLARMITLLLEGEGGVLWALVFLVILVSVLSQITTGVGL